MTTSHDKLLEELSVFADLGTEPPRLAQVGVDISVRMYRDGEQLELTLLDEGRGKAIERWASEEPQTHASYKALLASKRFGDLRRWADIQKEVLLRTLGNINELIPAEGFLFSRSSTVDVNTIDYILMSQNITHESSTQVLLIDGPAGIGKTVLIQQLALRRAERFKLLQCSLILHVQSRGRVLTNLQDLMAFSLQSLRLGVTYDQVPVLVRHGLVTLAIDSFDELGDPNGYELAWAQVNELVNFVRGHGTLVLAGRETFIGRERLLRDVKSLQSARDVVDSLTLQLPDPAEAKKWLTARGWNAEQFESPGVEVIFERGSYALRPFFLQLLADPAVIAGLQDQRAGFLLSFLVKHMIVREANKFGSAVDRAMDEKQRQQFVLQFLCETARDMAENQSESIDETTLSWIVEAALGEDIGDIPPEIVGLLKNRASVVAFLTTDDRPRYRRFAHSQLLSYFLSEVTVEEIIREGVPKYLRRNIVGPDFLQTFGELLLETAGSDPPRATELIKKLLAIAHAYISSDRGSRNLGAMLIAALPMADLVERYHIERLDIDDAIVQGTASPATIANVNINQFDIRGANIEAVTFSDTHIASLIADRSSKVGPSFGTPSWITDETVGATQVISAPAEIDAWLDAHGRATGPKSDAELSAVPADVRKHELYRLLGRTCRLRQYWIRAEDDDRAAKLVNDRWWDQLVSLLVDHELIRIEQRQASGRGGIFYHIKRPDHILSEDVNDPNVDAFYRHLIEAARAHPGG